jgi:hypothetical protein
VDGARASLAQAAIWTWRRIGGASFCSAVISRRPVADIVHGELQEGAHPVLQ